MLPRLQYLPLELICAIVGYFDTDKDINSFVRTCCHLYKVNDILYLHNAVYGQMSALLWAARHGILNTALYSLDASCGVSNTIHTIYQALPLAVRGKHTVVARILLSQKEVDVNIQHWENQYQKTQYLYQDQYQELHRRTHYQFCVTLLAMAARSGQVKIVKLLSMKNIDPDLGDESGLSPIAYAGCNGQYAVVKILLNAPTVDPNLKDCTGRTPLYWTINNGSEATASLFLLHPDVDINAAVDGNHKLKKGWTPLMAAVDRKFTELVELLLDMPGIDAERRCCYGKTVLHLAAIDGLEDIVRLLLAKGVNPDPKDHCNCTPLVNAASCGHLPIVELLCEAGACANTETDGGDTPILVAFYRKRDDIVRVLLEIGKMSTASPGKGIKRKPRSVSGVGPLSRSSKHGTDTISP